MEIISMDIRTFDALMARVKNHRGKGRHALQTAGRPRLEKMDGQAGGMRHSRHIEAYPTGSTGPKGLLPFGRIKNKLFYKPEDVEKVLQSYYHANSKKL